MAVATKKDRKVPVTSRAVIQRVNRILAARHEVVKIWRTSGTQGLWSWQPGDYYLVDAAKNALINGDVSLDALARELGALAKWEEIVD